MNCTGLSYSFFEILNFHLYRIHITTAREYLGYQKSTPFRTMSSMSPDETEVPKTSSPAPDETEKPETPHPDSERTEITRREAPNPTREAEEALARTEPGQLGDNIALFEAIHPAVKFSPLASHPQSEARTEPSLASTNQGGSDEDLFALPLRKVPDDPNKPKCGTSVKNVEAVSLPSDRMKESASSVPEDTTLPGYPDEPEDRILREEIEAITHPLVRTASSSVPECMTLPEDPNEPEDQVSLEEIEATTRPLVRTASSFIRECTTLHEDPDEPENRASSSSVFVEDILFSINHTEPMGRVLLEEIEAITQYDPWARADLYQPSPGEVGLFKACAIMNDDEFHDYVAWQRLRGFKKLGYIEAPIQWHNFMVFQRTGGFLRSDSPDPSKSPGPSATKVSGTLVGKRCGHPLHPVTSNTVPFDDYCFVCVATITLDLEKVIRDA